MTVIDESLSQKPSQKFDMDITERIENHRHVLLFGRGGIGKTTYLRRIILDVITPGGDVHFDAQEGLVPFYVPLKAIDDSNELPLLTYLLANNTYLSGASGLRRLARLAESGRLMLCLDGYDEISFAAVDARGSSLLQELEMLLDPDEVNPRSAHLSRDHQRFYSHAKYCRIWITSRAEFYRHNPFRPHKRTLRLELVGLPPGNRVRLVRRIFDRYAARLATANLVISHEGFVHEIERSGREELVELSLSPLFLTVMAYVYVNRTIQAGSFDIALSSNTVELIRECVSLLLNDLDEARARGLSAAARHALLCRRNEWIPEKRAFLAYFALELLLRNLSTFSFDDIRSHALDFFREARDLPNADLIVRNLSKHSPLPNFVEELIYCGLFTQVERSEHLTRYDFPHRKFREVLAADFLNSMQHAEPMIDKFVERPELEEALYVVFEATKFQNYIITSLCHNARPGRARFGGVLSTCLERAPRHFDPTPALAQFFFASLEQQRPFVLEAKVLAYVQKSSELLARLITELEDGIRKVIPYQVRLAAELLTRLYGPTSMESLLRSRLLSTSHLRPIYPHVLRHFLISGGILSEEEIAKLRSDSLTLYDTVSTLGALMLGERKTAYSQTLYRVLVALDRHEFVRCASVLRSVAPIIVVQLALDPATPPQQELVLWLVLAERTNRNTAYVITKGSVEAVLTTSPQATNVEEAIRAHTGRVYGTIDEIKLRARTNSGEASDADLRAKDPRREIAALPTSLLESLQRSAVSASELVDEIEEALEQMSYLPPVFTDFFQPGLR